MKVKRNSSPGRKLREPLIKDQDFERLVALRARWHRSEHLGSDPLGLLDRTTPVEDLEVVSFLVAGLSYGRVEQIRKSSTELLRRLGEWSGSGAASGHGLAKHLRQSSESDFKALERQLRGWKHRFNTAADLSLLLRSLGRVLRDYGSLGRLYQNSREASPNSFLAIVAFCDSLREGESGDPVRRARAAVQRGRRWPGAGVAWFAPNPRDGGTCKRLMMWMRWMVRQDSIDLGLWGAHSPLLDPAKAKPHAGELFFPVDTHIFQWARAKGVTSRKAPNWKVVEEITLAFRARCPEDPVGFDFSLCQDGMASFRGKKS